MDDEKLYPVVRAKARENVRECYEAIERQLEGRTWAVGSEFSAVDAYLFVFWRWGNGAKFDMAGLYPNYGRLMGEVSLRRSVVEAVREEGIEMI